MKAMIRKYTRGFTLIELLVVIAIIGLLAAIVLVSLQSSRQKARDARRIADLNQVAVALGLYYDTNRSFAIAPFCTIDSAIGPYLSQRPRDPLDGDATCGDASGGPGAVYEYGYYYSNTSGSPQDYLLIARLENAGSPSLRNDLDNDAPNSASQTNQWYGGATGSGTGESGAAGTVGCGDPAADFIYCIRS